MDSTPIVKNLPAAGFNIEILLDVFLQILQIVETIFRVFGINIGGA